MESVKAKVDIRHVPEHRIKKLESYQTLFDRDEATIHRERLIRNAGHAIAMKLAEFHKFQLIDNTHYWTLVSKIEIIVPETPENPWPPKPLSEPAT